MLERQIYEDLVQLRDVVWFHRQQKLNITIFNLDLEKAYDHMAQDFMLATLKKWGPPSHAHRMDSDVVSRYKHLSTGKWSPDGRNRGVVGSLIRIPFLFYK